MHPQDLKKNKAGDGDSHVLSTPPPRAGPFLLTFLLLLVG